MPERRVEHKVPPEAEGRRADAFLASLHPELSRSKVAKLAKEGRLLVDGRPAKPSRRLKAGEEVALLLPEEPPALEPIGMPLNIVYEDEEIVVVDKPRGLVVHPAPGVREEVTLVHALLAHCGRLSSIGAPLRPGIVHRLDRDTSGLIVVAKTDRAHLALQKQFEERRVDKRYLALVAGDPPDDHALIDAPIGRDYEEGERRSVGGLKMREALTEFWVKERLAGFTLLEVRIYSGRTHQIRVHMAFIGHPILGDEKYGPRKGIREVREDPQLQRLVAGLGGQALHAWRLSFDHPVSGRRLCFEAPPPPEMSRLIEYLRQRAKRRQGMEQC